MSTIILNDWKVCGSLAYQADFSKQLQDGIELPWLTRWVPATVPGSIYKDLENAGYIEDPYYGMNSLHCEWVANRWWTYKTTFSVSEEDLNDILKLTFKGIDYSAQIYLNGIKLGCHEGMYLPFECIINDYVITDKENTLVCIIEHAPFADAQPGYTSKTHYMKARYNYKWDFVTRLVNLGLYDEVVIHKHSVASISHSFVRPIKKIDGWNLYVEAELDGYQDATATLSFKMSDVNIVFTQDVVIKKGINKFDFTLDLSDFNFIPKLWWPNGYGEQHLYDCTLSVTANNKISDEIAHQIGFRTLEYIHADGREDALPYNIVINKKKIYLKGTNIVPLCTMQGCITQETLEMKLKAAKDCNINFFRIWGGGHIESEAFYSLCDQYGIMILQEFTMSSSGCDDVPSKDKHFLDLLHKVALYNGKLKRNHVSLTLWDGGNELTDERYLGQEDHEGHPATFEDSTLAMLKGILEAISPDIMMLPSSASGPNALLKVGDIGNNHDVHGPWGYVGAYEHYKFYNNSDSIVHGEFGCGGISNYEALKRFLPEKDMKLSTSYANPMWAHHSGGWDNYNIRERMMFGDLYDIPFADYIKINQFVQAESLRYSLEANRRRQWKNVGEMTWQFNEPWPNIQCSNVLDYYGGKKLAYYFMRDAYQSVLTSLKYDQLFYQPNDIFKGEVYLINDNSDAEYSISYQVITTENKVLSEGSFKGIAKEDVSVKVGDINVTLPNEITGGFIIRLSTVCGNFSDEKEYLMLIADKIIPVVLTDEDNLALQFGKKRGLANGVDAKRADIQPVIKYYDNYMKNKA